VTARLAKACFGKTGVYLEACFELAGTLLTAAMADQYFIRLLALGEMHLAVEIDFAKWPECPRHVTLSELLQRRDITKAFFAGHYLGVTREFYAQSNPIFSPNSAVTDIAQIADIEHALNFSTLFRIQVDHSDQEAVAAARTMTLFAKPHCRYGSEYWRTPNTMSATTGWTARGSQHVGTCVFESHCALRKVQRWPVRRGRLVQLV
jgi:hypothetical protein